MGWTARREQRHGTQFFSAGGRTEAERQTREERCIVAVVCETTGLDGSPGCGLGDATILPGDAVEPAIERAVEMARHVHNPPHGLPGPAPLPSVPLEDPDLIEHPEEVLLEAHTRLTALASRQPSLRLTAAEWHAESVETTLVNSRGQEGNQKSTAIDIEWVVVTGRADDRVESFFERRLRRLADLHLEKEFDLLAKRAVDRQHASPSPTWDGPVVVADTTLATFLDSGPIRFLGSAANRYAKLSGWEIGQQVVPDGPGGEPLTLWANRILPFGVRSCRFDDEGIPGQRVRLIHNNHLESFSATQRYAEYLNLPPTGEFGDLELPAGQTAAATLLAPPYLEVAGFSWFNPDPVTGDFATEIRMGYVTENGSRRPFRGGLLIGNLMAALGQARWSTETGFYGNYLGPTTGRFEGLKVAPTTG